MSLQVFAGLHKPYLYKGKAYQRSDTSTVEVAQVELKRLISTGENRYFEELPAPQQSLTFHRLEEKFATKLEITTLNDDIFKTLGFLPKIISGIEPQKFLRTKTPALAWISYILSLPLIQFSSTKHLPIFLF